PYGRQIALIDRPQLPQKETGKRIPNPVNGPAQLDNERRSSDPDGNEHEHAPGAEPAHSGAQAQGGTCRKQQLPGERIEIPDMPLRIGRDRDVTELYDDVEEERCRQDDDRSKAQPDQYYRENY